MANVSLITSQIHFFFQIRAAAPQNKEKRFAIFSPVIENGRSPMRNGNESLMFIVL